MHTNDAFTHVYISQDTFEYKSNTYVLEKSLLHVSIVQVIIEAASIVQVIRVNKKSFTLLMYASNRTSQDPEDHTKQNKVFSHQ